jgi:hypothetical protein
MKKSPMQWLKGSTNQRTVPAQAGGVSLVLQIEPSITSDFATSIRRTNLTGEDAGD